jgi:glycosyltransferase involved in cell wall biosynthesis
MNTKQKAHLDKNKISVFSLVKNEVEYIGYCIMSLLDYVDEFVYADGGSTDGTLELIRYIRNKYDTKKKIKLFTNKDCRNLRNAYTKLFNWTLSKCTGTHIWFCHPDMICTNPEIIREELDHPEIHFSTKIVSFAGDTKHIFTQGRDKRWASIYRNKFGLHYHGWYGAKDEDMYFKDITGNVYKDYKGNPYLPYKIRKTNIMLYHYCDTKPYGRRFGRMIEILKNVIFSKNKPLLEQLAKEHPRVNLQNATVGGRKFVISKTSIRQPKIFKQYNFERFKCEKG